MTFTIEQLEALKEGTTPGPWELNRSILAARTSDIPSDLEYLTDWEGEFYEDADGELAAASPALLDQLIAREAELQQLKMRIEGLADWHGIKAMKARDFPWPGEQYEARFQGKAETHETARDKLTQILEGHNE